MFIKCTNKNAKKLKFSVQTTCFPNSCNLFQVMSKGHAQSFFAIAYVQVAVLV